MSDSGGAGLVRWAVRAGLVAGTAVATTAVRRRVARRSAVRDAAPIATSDAPGALHSDPLTVLTDDGVGLHVEVEDGGAPPTPTIVFVPGFCLNMDAWHFQRADLRGGVRCVFYDQRGHGRSGRGEAARSTIEQLAADLRVVLDATSPGSPVVLVGHSLGGMVVMAYAAAHPEEFGDRVVGTALISTSPGNLAEMTLGLPPGVVRRLWRLSHGVVDLVAKRPMLIARGIGADRDVGLWVTRKISFGRSDVDPEVVRFAGEILNSTPLDVFGEFFSEFDRHDQEAALPVFRRVPTLILAGGKDVLTPVDHSRKMAAIVPDAELTIVPEAGHLVLLESPAEVNAALRRLLERVRLTTRPQPAGTTA
jgi:pimeloyl-ACP methyl ester carboxylesterase